MVLVLLVVGLGACAAKKPPRPPGPSEGARTATLNITYGIQVLGIAPMPPGFIANSAYAPLWLRQGNEIGVVGAANGETAILGFSGPGLGNRRMVAADSEIGGHILDVAANPDGSALAIGVARLAENRLDVIARSLDDQSGDRRIATVDGNFDSAEVSWLDPGTVALVLLGSPSDQPVAASRSMVLAGGGLYLIKTSGRDAVPQRLDDIRCTLSPLSFSPDGLLAIAQGNAIAPPAIIDLRRQTCHPLGLRLPVKVLAWAHDSASFLYAARGGEGPGASVFRYDVSSARVVRVAVSSAAAAYASDGTIVTLGSRDLSSGQGDPGRRVKAEVALIKAGESEIEVSSLGFETLPAMLAASTMIYSIASDEGVIDTATAYGPTRELIEYSYGSHAAFVLASGAAEGPVLASWSRDGRVLAFVDGDTRSTTLTVIATPR